MYKYYKKILVVGSFFILLSTSVFAHNNNINENEYKDLIEFASEKYGIDKALIKAIIRVESCFNPKAISKDGNQKGLMQLSHYVVKRYDVKDVFNPVQNIEGGVKYLSYLFSLFKDEKKAIAAYNAGEERIAKGTIPITTKAYVAMVLLFKKKYS